MKRRTFIGIVLAGLMGVGAVVVQLFTRKSGLENKTETEQERQSLALVTLLERHFPYLRLDREGMLEFANEYLKHVGPVSADPQQVSAMAMSYLLSTDFFLHDADESRLVKYEGFNSPYDSLCSNNPFARFS